MCNSAVVFKQKKPVVSEPITGLVIGSVGSCGSVTVSGKNYNKQSSFSSSFKYLCKTAVDWVNRIITISGSSDPAQ